MMWKRPDSNDRYEIGWDAADDEPQELVIQPWMLGLLIIGVLVIGFILGSVR
jgi:hypothetical protein